MPTTTRAEIFRFGPYQIDRLAGELTENGSKLKLQDQPFQILVALVERPGEVVSRDELRQRLWPGDTFVDFDNSMNIAVRKLRHVLNDNATQPVYIETLPKRGYRFLAPVVVIAEAPNEIAPVLGQPPASSAPTLLWWQKRGVSAGLASGLAVILSGYILLTRLSQPVNAGMRVRPAVAILGFRNLAAKSDSAWVSTALSEMMASELAGSERLRTVPGENVARAKIDLGLPDSDAFAAHTLDRIRKNLGADYVVTGSYYDSGPQGNGRLRLDLRLQDVRDGETLWADTESGTEADMPDLVARAGLGLRGKLGVAAAPQIRGELRASIPPTSEAARLYAEGLARLRQFDALGARGLLERAVATAPDFAPAHSALAAAWSALGYTEMAKQEARKAYDLSKALPRAERLSIEARFHESGGKWDKAIAIYKQLGDQFPDDLDYGLRRAAAQVKAGQGKDALATVAMLRTKPAAVRDDPAIDYMQSLAANQIGDFGQAQAAASRAAAEAESRSEGMLVADARLLECREFQSLGKMDAARTSCDTAKGLYARAGNRAGVAVATGYMAAALDGSGDHDGAQKLYETALSIQTDIGNQGGVLWDWNGLANLMWAKEDVQGARHNYEQAMAAAKEIGSRPDAADAQVNIGFTWLVEGDLGQARKAFEKALGDFREMGNLSGVGNALNNLGQTLYLQGDLSGANQKLEEALAIDRRSGEKAETADTLASLGRLHMTQGDLDGARARYNESLKMWREMGESYAAPVRVPIAELDIDAGRPGTAQGQIKQCIDEIKGPSHPGVLIAAHVMMARALLADGKPADATREIEVAAPLAARSQSRESRLEFAIAAARVRAATGRKEDVNIANKSLESASSEAKKFGFVGLHFAAELAEGEVQIAGGKDGSGIGRLKRVEQDAHSHGYEEIARAAHRRL